VKPKKPKWLKRALARKIVIVDDANKVIGTATLAEFFKANDLSEDEREQCIATLLDWGSCSISGAPHIRIEMMS
jgi:hypothetical protein